MSRKPRSLEMLLFELTKLLELRKLRKLSTLEEREEELEEREEELEEREEELVERLEELEWEEEAILWEIENDPELEGDRSEQVEAPERCERERRRLNRKRRALMELSDRLAPKEMQFKGLLTFQIESSGENWATTLGWFIPRKYRHVIGDILEDCAEMREAGCTESPIKFHVVYQWLIAVITLVPTAVKTSITDILKQVISPPK